ncbi:hypothetical protein [Amycolatopsis thailandensis]|uniref:hypothetical protein n=1 Tax=Amycolatopsis thailandensis TaxID=589330 RepID=UPI0036292385
MNSQPPNESPATEAETRAALLERSVRSFTPINKLFVQAPRGSESRHGPLSWFVRGRDLRALQAYLLVIGVNSSGASEHGWSTTLPIKVWARAFGTTRHATDASAATAVSKVLTRLEKRKLIERGRRGRSREIRVGLLREDGTGEPYTRPGKANGDRFLKLPHAFWTDGWHEKLDLPATAMLLVALHEKPGFELPTEFVPDWYGWSADTAERGFKTLRDLGLLQVFTRHKKAPLSPTGLTEVNQYYLLGPFAQARTAPTIDDYVAQVQASPDAAPPADTSRKKTTA